MVRKESLIKKLLRILTPSEISEMTTTVDGGNRVVLTDLIENLKLGKEINFENPVESRFIPFTSLLKILELRTDGFSYQNLTDIWSGGKNEILISGEKVFSLLLNYQENLKNENILSFRNSDKKDTLLSKDGRMYTTSLFILNEKARFKNNNFKLKEKQIINSYSNLSEFTPVEKNKEEDEKKITLSTHLGKIVNKKAS